MIKYPEIADISVVADRIYLKNRVIVGSLPLKIKFIYSLISYLAYLGEKWPELTAKQTTWCRGHVPSWGGESILFPHLWSGTLSPSHCELSIPSHFSPTKDLLF